MLAPGPVPRDPAADVPDDPPNPPSRAAASALATRGLILLIAAVAVAARVPSLSDGLWYDELAAWTDYAARGAAHALTTYHDPANHVLQSALTAISVDLAGAATGAEFAMRLPSLLASLAAVALIAALARAAGGTRRTAAIAGVLAAACPVLALSGTEARGYAFMIAGSAGAHLAWLAWRRRPGAKPAAGYAAAMLAGAWAHPVTAIVSVGHALDAVTRAATGRSRRPLADLVPVAVAGAVVATAFIPVLGQMRQVSRTFGRASGDQPSPFGIEGLHLVLQLGGAWSPWALAGLVAAALGTAGLVRRTEGRALVMAWAAGAVALLLLATLGGTWMYARFALFLVPPALVAMASHLDSVASRAGRGAAIGLATVLLATWTVDLIDRPPRQPIREAAAWIDARRSPGARVLEVGLFQEVSRAYLGAEGYRLARDLGRDIENDLDVFSPEYLLVLYPGRLDSQTIERIREGGYAPAVQFDGWIDWGQGDVAVWIRDGSSPGRRER